MWWHKDISLYIHFPNCERELFCAIFWSCLQAGRSLKMQRRCSVLTAVQHSSVAADQYVNANCCVILINPLGCWDGVKSECSILTFCQPVCPVLCLSICHHMRLGERFFLFQNIICLWGCRETALKSIRVMDKKKIWGGRVFFISILQFKKTVGIIKLCFLPVHLGNRVKIKRVWEWAINAYECALCRWTG